MPTAHVDWWWEEAFDRNGFGDGDGLVMTGEVVSFIESLGYSIDADSMGMHNYIIISVRDEGGKEWCPDGFHGDIPPREFLPPELVRALDERFPAPDGESYDW